MHLPNYKEARTRDKRDYKRVKFSIDKDLINKKVNITDIYFFILSPHPHQLSCFQKFLFSSSYSK